jgi:hypothetical protein
MSEDGFLTRWSRRKAEAKAEPQPATAPEQAPEAKEPASAAPPAEPQKAADEVDLSALPPLEEITSATDITGFLKRGVPEALRTAALRKAWTSDPMIRDFIGLSENSWDFNDPTAIPGFGPIDMPAERVQQMAAELVGEVRKAVETIDGALEQAMPQQDAAEQAPRQSPDTASPPRVDIAMQQKEPAAPQQLDSAPADAKPRPRSHGSALPR